MAEATAASPLPRVVPFGDAAVLVTVANEASLESAARAQAVARRIRAAVAGRPGWGAVVPAAATVLIQVDPVEPGVEAAIARLHDIAGAESPADDRWADVGPAREVPTRYGGELGPDLDAVAEAAGLLPAQVVEAHAAATYRCLFLGFAPGFGYLGPLPPELVLPRRATPRVRIPAGSVAIAGPHTAIYPIESPGGWHILGRTATLLWDPRRDPPAILEPGARVRFVPVRS